MTHGLESVKRALAAVRGTGTTVSGLLAGIAVAFGVPLAWVWLASRIAGTSRELTPSLAIFITTGILVSYWIALLIGGWLRGRTVDDIEERGRVRRRSWNRSFTDQPVASDRRIDPVERLFIVVAVIAIVAFDVWFFFFAGDPLPSQPAF